LARICGGEVVNLAQLGSGGRRKLSLAQRQLGVQRDCSDFTAQLVAEQVLRCSHRGQPFGNQALQGATNFLRNAIRSVKRQVHVNRHRVARMTGDESLCSEFHMLERLVKHDKVVLIGLQKLDGLCQ